MQISLKRKYTPGFTLLEVLVVMTLIAFIAGLVIPRIGMSLANLKLKAGARGCAGLLRNARSLAITTRKRQKVSFEYRKLPNTQSTNCVICRIENIKRFKPFLLDQAITLSWKNDSEGDWQELGESVKYEVVFDHRGYTSGGILKLTYYKDMESREKFLEYSLIIDPITGRVNIKKIAD